MSQWGVRRVLVVTDPYLAGEPSRWPWCSRRFARPGIDAVVFDQVRVEPTDDVDPGGHRTSPPRGASTATSRSAAARASTRPRRRTSMPTYPAEFLAYVNPPIGQGRPVPGRLKPLIAVPTTAGTGSETTGRRHLRLHAAAREDGHRAPRAPAGAGRDRPGEYAEPAPPGGRLLGTRRAEPCGGVVHRPALPPAARAGAPRPAAGLPGGEPDQRRLVERAIELVSRHLVRAMSDPTDDEARGQMLLAATFAGIGFGNAGVHLPHGMSYPVSGMVRDFVPAGYPAGRPLIPHGMSVILNAPAAFRFTAPADPGRHLDAARLLGADVAGARPEDAGELLAGALIALMRQTGMPNGLKAVGYGPDDVDALVAGTIVQHRVTKLSPRPASEADLKELFLDSMTLW